MKKNIVKVETKKNSKGKRVLKILGASLLTLTLLGATALSGFTGYSIADGLTYQNRGNDTIGNSIKQLEIWNYDVEKFENTFSVQEITFKSEDDNVVPAFYYESIEKSTNTVILVHGMGGDHVSVYPQAEIYLNNGWNVLAIDQRGHGVSENEKVSFGHYESLDIKAAVDYVKSSNEKGKLVVHGISCGAATTGIYSGLDHSKGKVDAFILDSAFDNMANMFLLHWEHMETGIPNDYAVFCGDIALKLRFGYGFKDASASESVKNCTVPTLVIQGTADDVSTVAMGEEIFENINTTQKEYWLIDSKHVEGVIDYPVQYKEKVLNFIN